MDIVFITNGVRTLLDVDVVIVNSIHTNLVSLAISFCKVVAMIVTQAKVMSYCD
jgi:hypothetical protein